MMRLPEERISKVREFVKNVEVDEVSVVLLSDAIVHALVSSGVLDENLPGFDTPFRIVPEFSKVDRDVFVGLRVTWDEER
jgi:hypothetical protein